MLNAPIAKLAKEQLGKMMTPLIRILAMKGIHSDIFNLSGIVFSLFGALAIAINQFYLGAFLLLVAGLCDIIDGQLARFTNTADERGSFLDSTSDQISDIAIWIGILWHYLFEQDTIQSLMIIIVFISLSGSMLSSHIRARSGMSGINCGHVGLAQRGERMVLLIASLVLGILDPIMWILAFINILSVFQRLRYVLRMFANEPA